MALIGKEILGASFPGAEGREIPVWDPLVRLVHWSVALAVLLNGMILEEETIAHQLVGYAAVTLVAVRLIWGLIGPRPARFSAFPPSLKAALTHVREIRRGKRVAHLSHNPLGALMAYNLWATIIALGVTGYLITTASPSGAEVLEEVHEAVFNWLMLSVALHVGGVLFESRRTGVNLVRAMINGRKRIPDGVEVE